MMRIFGAFIIAAAMGACAQASSPPGGDPDRYAPRVISTTPDTNAIGTAFNAPVVIKFDETLSERGVREEDMVIVSPETGEVDIKRSGDEIRVEIAGGWQAGRIYHVTVMPGVQDRFGNPRAQPYELVFSTGPAIPPTAVAGLVTDRLTARPVANARVSLMNTADSSTYVTLTDTAGFFAMRSLPLGTYGATAFLDQNRNREIDFAEARDIKVLTLTAARDTPVVEMSVLAPDTTPARLLRAEAVDTSAVRIVFDDFIPPAEPLAGVAISLWHLPDSTRVPIGGALMHPRAYEAQRAVKDTSAAVKPPVAMVPGGDVRPVAADTVRLPTQELMFVPARPLTPGTRYRIIVRGVRNMLGLPDGGGSVPFETPARARPAAPRDSTAAPRDTTGARPVPGDTIRR
jgi:hypothetical protein